MAEHELKIWPEFFDSVASGEKPFELRHDDRGFRVGDTLILKEWKRVGGDGHYTGRETRKIVTCILAGGQFGLERDFVAMGLKAAKLDELESRLSTPASVSEEPDISDRWLWNEALDLHRDSEGGSANGLHIYFALQRVRKSALAAASTGGESAEDSQDLSGWIMGDSEGRRWRGWGNYGPTWQTDPMKAIRFARRKDAEAVFAEDEDAWTVIELAAAIRSQKDGE